MLKSCAFARCSKKFVAVGRKKYCSDACKMKAYRNKKRYDVNRQKRKTLHQTDHEEWYTPKPYLEAVRAVLGTIDYDPASTPFANQIVQAKQIFTLSDDGLQKQWFGQVFLNPPYGLTQGKSNQALWSQKLINEYKSGRCTEAILLVNASTGARWFAPLWAYPICFVNHRIHFYSYSDIKNQPTHHNAFVYFGNNAVKFAEQFSVFGHVTTPNK